MKQTSFGNFQVGQVDNPSIEDKGGFEFASGMDIFSEPGVLKASLAMTSVSLGAGASLTADPLFMRETADASNTRAYMIAGAKILESTDGSTWNLFLTNANGTNLGLEIFNGYVYYASASKLGRCPVGNAAGKNDNFATIETDDRWHPMAVQAGTLKIGAGRFIVSVDESSTVTAEAMKMPSGYRAQSLAEYFRKLFTGTRFGALSGGTPTTHDATVFDWNGIILATGSALPDNPYSLRMRGMHALFASSEGLLGFPDVKGQIYRFDGNTFLPYRTIPQIAKGGEIFRVDPGAIHQHIETVIFGGSSGQVVGVYQMKNGALCEAFVPSVKTPGDEGAFNIFSVRSAFNGRVIIGYSDGLGNKAIEISHATNKQNNAMMRTLWHKMGTDQLKRHYGVKLNLKPMAANTVVTVAYRTGRSDAFTSVSQTLTPSTQDKPIYLPVQPRTREIQYRFTYTTSGANTPELLSYDPLFEVLKSNR